MPQVRLRAASQKSLTARQCRCLYCSSILSKCVNCGLVRAQLYLIEWSFTLFAKSLPAEPVAWIWDQVLLLGDEYLHRTMWLCLFLPDWNSHWNSRWKSRWVLRISLHDGMDQYCREQVHIPSSAGST